MPVLGIIASQISGHLWAPSGAYDSIATTTLSTATASITFSSIPQTYTHLQVRGLARSNRASTRDGLKLTINGNSSDYTYHNLYGDGTSPTAQSFASQSELVFNDIAGANATAGVFGVMVIDILDYTSSTKIKTIRALGGADNNGSGIVGLNSGAYYGNTNAVTSITLQGYVGTNLSQYSSFALYGIRGN